MQCGRNLSPRILRSISLRWPDDFRSWRCTDWRHFSNLSLHRRTFIADTASEPPGATRSAPLTALAPDGRSHLPNQNTSRSLAKQEESELTSGLGHLYRSPGGRRNRVVNGAFKKRSRTTPEGPVVQSASLQRRASEAHEAESWNQILLQKNSYYAIASIQKRAGIHGDNLDALSVLLKVLRRPHVDARALRLALQQGYAIVTNRSIPKLPKQAVYLLFVHLLRHARGVWPQSMLSITELLLSSFSRKNDAEAIGTTDTASHELTEKLNVALVLLSRPTAVLPFRDIEHQKAAIIRVLQYMTERQPNVALKRIGYRAVARVQLAEPKETRDREWAALKTQSWPPWKVDRTAVDTTVTHLTHGISAANHTLRSAQEAGYSSLAWEQAAKINSGWDNDGTPSIQSRRILMVKRWTKPSAVWCARITSTRTIQEAWAAYLAWEELKHGPDQEVFLAILNKLHEQEMAPRLSPKRIAWRTRERRILPGDVRQISPLPPSTHLYTYTKTPPPTVEQFYRSLRAKGIEMNMTCLSFLVANAASMQQGLEFLQDGEVSYPCLRALRSYKVTTEDLHPIPDRLFNAYVTLLARNSAVPVRYSIQFHGEQDELEFEEQRVLPGLMRAFHVLFHRHNVRNVALVNCMKSLTHTTTIANMSRWIDKDREVATGWRNSELALAMMRRLFALVRRDNLSPGAEAFQHFCLAHENASISSWALLNAVRHKPCTVSEMDRDARRALAHNLKTSQGKALKFRFLKTFEEYDETLPHIPKLSIVPSTVVLHAYVRACGMAGDLDSILWLLKWCVRHHEAIERKDAVRWDPRVPTRRFVVSIRAFVERHWLTDLDHCQSEDDNDLTRALQGLITPPSVAFMEEVKQLVEGVKSWGGWPSDEEVREYCTHPNSRMSSVARRRLENEASS